MFSYHSVRNKNLILLPALLLLLFSCSNESRQPEADSATRPVVEVMHPQLRSHSHEMRFSGTLKPWREANLGTSIPGRVEKLYFAEGDYVQQGALIAQLSAEPAVMAEAEVKTWEADYQRVLRLQERGSVTPQEFDHVEAQYKAARAKYELMQKNTRILAPFSGYIMEVLVQQGETFLFQPGLQQGVSHAPGIVRLMQLNPMKVEIHVPENRLRQIQQVDELALYAAAFPGETFPATLERVKPLVSLSSRTLAVELRVDNPDQELMVGMYVNVEARLPGQEYLFLPRHALQQQDEQYYVWCWNPLDEKLEKKEVDVLFLSAGYAALQGVEEADAVVLSGFSRLREGMQAEGIFAQKTPLSNL